MRFCDYEKSVELLKYMRAQGKLYLRHLAFNGGEVEAYFAHMIYEEMYGEL